MKVSIILLCLLARSCAFLVSNTKQVSHRTIKPQVFGISEWRDSIFDYPGTGDDRRLGTESGAAPKEICVLPFPFDEVLLQGETKQLRLYEDRFIQLFDYCMERHSGVVAMGLLAESGIIQTVPLCEVEAYNRMEGFGVFVTIRVVGRAQLDEIIQQEPYLTGVCREIADKIPPNLELPNLVASNIENFMLLLSSMEHRLSQAVDQVEDDDEDTAEMRRRIQVAKLVSINYYTSFERIC
jgi:Lon protease-like protein